MTDPTNTRVQSAQEDVRRYAEEAKGKLTGDQSSSWWGDITGVIQDMGNRADALAAGAKAGEMALNPDYLGAVSKQFDDLRNIVNELRVTVRDLGTETPLGMGLGKDIGTMNAQLGIQASELLEALTAKIETMSEAVKASVANYLRVDDAAASGLNKM